MNKSKRKVKSILNYLSTIFSWALFVVLICIAGLLLYYFIDMKKNASNQSYKPKFSIYTIVSPSMTPLIKVYDVIINTRVNSPTEIGVGDIITFKSTSPISSGMTVTHRVIEIQNVNGEYRYITKGDNNLVPDTSAALYNNVIGKAFIKIPQVGRLQVFIASPFGWIILVVLPALYIIIKDIYKVIKLNNLKKTADKENKALQIEANNGNINNESKEKYYEN